MSEKEEEKKLPPHHQQLPLCTTRSAYRKGRELTAVKVYTVHNESNHLLIFGVPSLNLRREAKELCVKFGQLLQFHAVTEHPAEDFTETYHACFQRIQSARVAKKVLDTKNFYGGSLHVSYAPELETIQETRAKLLQRKKDVLFRLNKLYKDTLKASNTINSNIDVNNQIECNLNIHNEDEYSSNIYNEAEYSSNIHNEVGYNMNKDSRQNNEIVNEANCDVNINKKKLNMGQSNLIYVNNNKRKLNKKDKIRKRLNDVSKSNECFIKNSSDIVDCTSVNKSVVSNINDALNYSNFGNEVIKKIDLKPVNKIVFNFNKKS